MKFEKLLDCMILKEDSEHWKMTESESVALSKRCVGLREWFVSLGIEVMMFLLWLILPIQYRNLTSKRQTVCWFLCVTVLFGLGIYIRHVGEKLLLKKGQVIDGKGAVKKGQPFGWRVLLELLYFVGVLLLGTVGFFLFSLFAPASASLHTVFLMSLLLTIMIEFLIYL